MNNLGKKFSSLNFNFRIRIQPGNLNPDPVPDPDQKHCFYNSIIMSCLPLNTSIIIKYDNIFEVITRPCTYCYFQILAQDGIVSDKQVPYLPTYQCPVACCKRRDSHHMHITVNSLLGNLHKKGYRNLQIQTILPSGI